MLFDIYRMSIAIYELKLLFEVIEAAQSTNLVHFLSFQGLETIPDIFPDEKKK